MKMMITINLEYALMPLLIRTYNRVLYVIVVDDDIAVRLAWKRRSGQLPKAAKCVNLPVV